jgi:hypothetical protein
MQIGNLYGNASKDMDDNFLIQIVPFIFLKVNFGGISQTNCHLLIIDGHGSHFTLDAIKQTMDFVLNMITLPSQISHAF